MKVRTLSRAVTGIVAGLLASQLVNPAPASASVAEAPTTSVAPAGALETVEPADETAATKVAIPVVRDVGGVFLYVVRPAAFGLTSAHLEAAGLPVVPAPGPGSAPMSSVAPLAVPLDHVIDTIDDLAGEDAADTTGTSGGPVAMSSVSTAAANVKISVYSDQSNLAAFGDSYARTAWYDAQSVLSAEAALSFDVALYQEDAAAFPNDPSLRVTDVTNDCGLQRFARWEEAQPYPAEAVLVFSDGKIQPTGWPSPTYGLAIDGDVSRRWSRGQSDDFCTAGARRSPAYIPSAHVSTDLAWAVPAGSEKQAPSHWAAHEVGHLFGLRHDQASCTDGLIWHQHQTLEAATSDVPSHCTSNDSVRHAHFTFAQGGRDAIKNEHARFNGCKTSVWCSDSNTTPSAVRNLTGSVQSTQVTLSWLAPAYKTSSVAGYCIYKGRQNNFLELSAEGPDFEEECVGNQTTYTWSGLANGQTYFFYVRAWQSTGATRFDRDGPRSNIVSLVPGAAPNAPSLNPITSGDRQLSLSWSVPANNGYSIANYRIYRGTCSGCETLLTTVGTGTSYVDTGLTNGQTYYYQVAAVNARGEGPRSNEQWNYPRTFPGAPTLNSATAGDGQVALAWSAPASDGGTAITGYRVYRGTTAGGSKTLVETGGCRNMVNGFSCTDAGLSNGTTYYYVVKAVNNVGDGASSNERGATPAAAATPSFTEEWESGLGAWTVTGTGATQDCAVGRSGCSLRMASTSSAGVAVARNLSIGMSTPTTVSYWMRGSQTWGDTDASIGVGLNTGNEVRLAITEPANNNGMNLYGPSNSTGVFHNWGSANVWYEIVVSLNPTTDVANVQVKDASGNVVATSANVTLPASATSVTKMSFDAVHWGGSAVVFHFDGVRVVGAAAGFSETWEGGLGGWTVTGSGATQDCTVGVSGCSLRMASTSSAGLKVARTLSHTMSNPTTVSFWMRGNLTYGDTDASIGVGFNTGNEVRLAITEPANNNGMNFHGPSSSTGVFYNWPSANTWYQVVMSINPTSDVASVQVKDAAGSVLASSGSVVIPAAATTVTGMSFDAVHWGGTAVAFNFDTVSIT